MKRPAFWISSVVAALVIALAIHLWTHKPLDPLTAQSLAQARQIWQNKRPQDYQMDVVVSGAQQGHHQITVRNNKVTKMLTDGVQTPERVWEYWNIEGMFRFLNEELVQAKQPQMAYGISDPSKVYLSTTFDPALGYPQYFLRQVFGKKVTIEWEIKNFQVAH